MARKIKKQNADGTVDESLPPRTVRLISNIDATEGNLLAKIGELVGEYRMWVNLRDKAPTAVACAAHARKTSQRVEALIVDIDLMPDDVKLLISSDQSLFYDEQYTRFICRLKDDLRRYSATCARASTIILSRKSRPGERAKYLEFELLSNVADLLAPYLKTKIEQAEKAAEILRSAGVSHLIGERKQLADSITRHRKKCKRR